jgi:murein DD-endopeptidase MepM/ murein hydrolase activator NlpD
MSPRPTGPNHRLATSYFVTISRGDSLRSLVIRPWQIYASGALALVVLSLGTAAGAFQYFRDDVISNLLVRQAEMQYAYEDRLSSMRSQIDRIASKQLLNQDTIEGRVHDLLSRQAQLETRASMIASLAKLGGATLPAAAEGPLDKRAEASAGVPGRSLNPLLANAGKAALPPGVSAFAPLEPRVSVQEPATDKPRPEIPASSVPKSTLGPRADAGLNPDVPVPLRLEALSTSLEHMERTQVRAVTHLAEATRSKSVRLRNAISEAGLPVDRLTPPNSKSAVGGPFVPIREDADASPFERQIVRLQNEAVAADRLEQVLPYLPLRRPLNTKAEVTSNFGQRLDPFMGRLAMHTGLDMREEYGSPVRVTAAGTVTNAGWSGGYGNMVEVEHGNGLATRYGHLSTILVTEGQRVTAGTIIGKLGSTGRSTGPHLHYEVRVDGEAVDPVRFLRAADKLAQDTRSTAK